jgi:hypothetical protein
MSKHDYLVLGMAAVWLITNFVGAAFTLRRLFIRGNAPADGRPLRTAPPSASITSGSPSHFPNKRLRKQK